ncbi:MAG: hypothetical protein CSA11_03310 [Chloroflexi bacterium]|nr:MAG: hypothetical protein CSA11_03310 [Chloroflexota bacterium]
MKSKVQNQGRCFWEYVVWRKWRYVTSLTLVWLTMIGLAGCQPKSSVPSATVAAPTTAVVARLAQSVPETTEIFVPATWTPMSSSAHGLEAPAMTQFPTSTPRATRTAVPPLKPTLTLTSTPTPIITPEPVTATPEIPDDRSHLVPTVPTNPTLGGNILPNGSFEEGHYNMWGIPELQLPVGWVFEWDEAATGFGSAAWDVYIRPETRVLSTSFLPASEHGRFIFDGEHTIKIFKANGAISFRLFQDLELTPGTYELEINVYPDLYMDYQDGVKIWADDPETGQFRFIAPGATGWMGTAYGRKNTFTHTFTVDTAGSVRIGAAMRGNHAIMNDGWFMDDWSLRRVES